MQNSSEVTFFILGAYGEIGSLKYLYFILLLIWYICICASNLFLMVVIISDRRLHEPMYFFLCNLCVSEISASTSLYPLLLSQMFSDTHEISVPACFLQMFYIYLSAPAEFCSLAAMAYDRLVAICYPLFYSTIISNNKAVVIIVLIWSYSVVNVSFVVVVMVNLKFCGNVIDKIFCDQHLIIKLACSASPVSRASDLVFAATTIVIPFCFISASYIKILRVCLNTTKENKLKAIITCTPQIVSVSNIFIGIFFHFINSKFRGKEILSEGNVFFSVYLIVCQPALTPFMYGLILPKVRQSCGRFLFRINIFIKQFNKHGKAVDLC